MKGLLLHALLKTCIKKTLSLFWGKTAFQPLQPHEETCSCDKSFTLGPMTEMTYWDEQPFARKEVVVTLLTLMTQIILKGIWDRRWERFWGRVIHCLSGADM